MSRPFAAADLRSACQSPGKWPPCVTTPTSAVFGLKQTASLTVATIGTPSSVSPARFESRIATTDSRRYRMTPHIVLP